MSECSVSTANTDFSAFSNPPAYRYRLINMSSHTQHMSLAEKHETILALKQHRINTLIDLRRVEKAFALLDTPDISEPMTAAWTYYVSSHSLLTELRGLTRTYAFSSHCVEEAKMRVYSDPASNRSWNLCWLVLKKIEDDGLIRYYAQYQAALPASWGECKPDEGQVQQFTEVLVREWKGALQQMLRYWEVPPTH